MTTSSQPLNRNFIVFLFLFSCFFSSFSLLAQAPDGINYQAVARDNNGNVLDNRLISVRFGILATSPTGTLLHEEEHSLITTNDFGLFNLVIGRGTRIGGTAANFAAIDWSNTDHFLRVQIEAGNGFENLGTTQLLSVPYAIYAKTAGSSSNNIRGGAGIIFRNDSIINDGDLSETNELISSFSLLPGNILRISEASVDYDVDLTPLLGANTDNQNLRFSSGPGGDSILIERGQGISISFITDQIAANTADIATNLDSITNVYTNLLARINADSVLRYENDTALLNLINSSGNTDNQNLDVNLAQDSILIDRGDGIDITFITSPIATNASNIATNTTDIATNTTNISTNTTDISTNTTNISNNALGIIDSTADLNTRLLARINADSLLRYVNDTTISGQLRDTSLVLRSLINGISLVDYDPRITADSIRLENLESRHMSDSVSKGNAISTNANAIFVNGNNIATNITNISNNAQGIIDSTADLNTRLLARINADSLLSYINDTTLSGQLRDTSMVLRGLIGSIVSTDDQQISFSVSGDTIVLEDGGILDISDIRDSLGNYHNRILSNQAGIISNTSAIIINASDIATNTSDIATNTTAISTNATNISTNTTDISDLGTDLGTLQGNFTADSTLTLQNRDSIDVLAGLIGGVTDNQNLDVNLAQDSILIDRGDGIDITFITSPIATNAANIATNVANIATNSADIATNTTDIATNTSAISTNASDIATNTTAISTNATNISTNTSDISDLGADLGTLQGNFTADSTLTLQNRDSIDVLAGLLGGVTDNQNLDVNLAQDSILIDRGDGVDITFITSPIATNASNIATNTTDIANLTTQVNAYDSTKIQFGTTAVTIPTVDDAIFFQTNGSTALTIDQNQRSIFSDLVGIATPTPSAFLGILSNNEGIPSANFNTIGGDAPAEGLIMTTNGVANDAFGIFSTTFGGSNSIGIRTLANSSSSVMSDSSIALFARASGVNNNVYSGFFDRGNVFIRDTLILPTGASNGYILTSDANGAATWQMPVIGGNVNTAGGNTVNRLAYWNSADSITSFDDVFIDVANNRVGIGTTNPTQKLQVNGGIRVSAGFNANNGTQGAPAFRFESDPNTGMFSNAADELAFTTGGSEAARFDANGNLGIGTATPDSTLTVNGGIKTTYFTLTDGAASGSVLTSDANGVASWQSPSNFGLGTPGQLTFFTTSDTLRSSSELFWEEATARLRIGSNTSTSKLTISGNDTNTVSISNSISGIAVGSNTSALMLQNNGSNGNNFGLNVNVDGGSSENRGISATVTGGTSVYGISTSANGQAGTSTAVGGFHYSTSINGEAYGIRAIGSNINANSYGVRGDALGTGTNNYGLYGNSIGSAANNYGVYGNATNGITNYAGYFNQGDVFIRDTLILNETFRISNGAAAGNILVSDGAGNASWAPPSAPTCPVGMTNVGGNICMETNERATANWFTAASTCVAAGYQLPTWAEWYGAADNAALTNETNNWEWVNDGTSNTARKVGNGGLQNTANDDPATGSAAYRCIYYLR